MICLKTKLAAAKFVTFKTFKACSNFIFSDECYKTFLVSITVLSVKLDWHFHFNPSLIFEGNSTSRVEHSLVRRLGIKLSCYQMVKADDNDKRSNLLQNNFIALLLWALKEFYEF